MIIFEVAIPCDALVRNRHESNLKELSKHLKICVECVSCVEFLREPTDDCRERKEARPHKRCVHLKGARNALT